MPIHRRNTKQGRWSLGLIVALATVGVVAPQADASQLRRLAPSVTSFATDGVRYAAWQENPAAPIVVLDTLDGSEREITTPGCVLEEPTSTHESGEGGMPLPRGIPHPRDTHVQQHRRRFAVKQRLSQRHAGPVNRLGGGPSRSLIESRHQFQLH